MMKIFLGVSAATIVAAGATVGICYVIWHKQKNPSPITTNDTITFSHYFASMTSGSQTISATSSEGKAVTLTADGSGKNTAWTFINNTLNYETVTSQTTVAITADDTITTNSINIDLLPEVETSFSVSCTNTIGPNLVFNTADTLSLTWTSFNYTPTTIQLKNDTAITDKWELSVPSLSNHQMTLSRKVSNVPAGVYNVIIIGTDGTNTNEATVVVTISNPFEKDLFFTTGDTTTTPNSTKAFYGTISASSFTLCADTNLKVKVDGAVSSTWTAKTFDNKTHIKIAPPNSLSAGEKFQISIYDSQNYITSNAIVFSVQTKMTIDNDYYVAIKNDGTLSRAAVTATVSLSSQNLVGLYFGQNNTVTTLSCNSNQLTQLDVSNNSELRNLQCYSNQLTSLDVSNNSELRNLQCYSNQLTSLDVSNNSQLTDLHCFNNQLQQLDVSNNSLLTALFCNDNQLTSLDVSNNSQLSMFSCYSNPFNLIKLPTNRTVGGFTFATSATMLSWTAYQYAATGDIYCNASLTVIGRPSTWIRHDS